MDTSTQLSYKNYPLLRHGDELYYGNMSDKFVVYMKILGKKIVGNVEVPNSVQVQMHYTDPDIKGKNKVYKQSEKDSLSAALELANAWLVRGK